MSESTTYWFRAKRYGWGWGLPCAWQGWVVFVAYVALVFVGVRVFQPKSGDWSFMIYLLVLSGGLVAIAFVKGEPPRWRWGKDETPS